ncbi:NADPH-dependent F420 reductase [Hymenobacter terrenus]|uniref:NADPH-dependent F420 reductase n=1 Tax=Hymenobacter terrenus TaxID=1629124 RepID=UPI000619B407|nr:NADPH-dependent F420 reductase [Hymenobacter terrenus]
MALQKIGIVGAGLIGGNLARLFTQAGHQVLLSFSRAPQKLRTLTQELGSNAQAGTPAEAAAFGDIIVLSVHFAALDAALAQTGNLQGKILIDTNNPFDITLPPGVSGAQEIARRLPGAHIVKAFNTQGYTVLLEKSFATPRLVMPLAGDDAAKDVVASLIVAAGFEPFDLGNLAEAHLQEPNGPFYNKALDRAHAQTLLAAYSTTRR